MNFPAPCQCGQLCCPAPYYLAGIQSDLQCGSNVFWTTLSNARKNRLLRASKRGMRAVVNAPTTTSTSSTLSLLNIVSLERRTHLKLLLYTFLCVHTHALASPSLCNQYTLRTPENSTRPTTRSQSVRPCAFLASRCQSIFSLEKKNTKAFRNAINKPKCETDLKKNGEGYSIFESSIIANYQGKIRHLEDDC